MMMQERLGVEESFGKVNISPSQVAFIVDQYLCANNLSHTRATFRMESSLLAGSSFNQACVLVPSPLSRTQTHTTKYTGSSLTREKIVKQKPRGRPPGKKNQVKGLNVLPPLGTQSLIVNSTATGSQVPTTSSIIETQPGTATNKSVTTCNKDVVTHCEAVMVCPEEEITNKLSLRPFLISSDSDTEDKSELNYNASHVFLENSIPNGFSIPETEKEHSQLDLSHIKFSDLDMEYWSNFSLKDTCIFAEDYYDFPAISQVDA